MIKATLKEQTIWVNSQLIFAGKMFANRIALGVQPIDFAQGTVISRRRW